MEGMKLEKVILPAMGAFLKTGGFSIKISSRKQTISRNIE